jgi:MFS family permease
MALIGMAFGLGFTLGPLVGLLAVPSADAKPGPGPGYAAAGLSAFALALALFRLPESRHAVSQAAESHRVSRRALRTALATPSIGLILASLFVCVFSFAMFETTLSLLIKGGGHMVDSPFALNWQQVCWTFAYIGLTLTLVQGGLVRRLAGRVSEGALAGSGAALEIVGFGLVLLAVAQQSTPWLLVALGVVVAGFAFMQPSLNGLLSRRSDPQQQGVVMGVGQSVSSLARIVGSAIGIPLLAVDIPSLDIGMQLPFYVAIGLMALGLLLVLQAARRGRDF